jgi:soluble lytic murein transglycosylase
MASELGDTSRVLSLLVDLEGQLPLLRDEIVDMRAHAYLVEGPQEAAYQYFKNGSGMRDVLLAARALQASGKPREAAELLDREIKRHSKRKRKLSQLAKLRRTRAELAEDQKENREASQHYRWLALEHPTLEASRTADIHFERLTGTKLTKLQRFARAEEFTKDGNHAATQRELQLLTTAPGVAPSGAEILRTRAWSYYRSRADYAKAAKLFAQCAKLQRKHRVQDLFFSARALSRSHQNEAAIAGYQALANRYPSSGYAEQARYLAARLYYLGGRFKEAALAYGDYLKRYRGRRRRARYAKDVNYERAVTHLALGTGGAAVAPLTALLQGAKNDRQQALLQQLLGIALLQSHREAEAVELWRGVIADSPLSFAALMSAERLAQLEEPPSPVIPERGAVDALAVIAPPPDSTSTEASFALSLPPKVELLLELGLDLDAEAELRRNQADFKKQHAPNGGRALCEAYGMMSTAAARYAHAQRVVRERVLKRAVTPETRWLWECIYPAPYADSVKQYGREYQVLPGLTHAVMRQESAFRPTVKSPVGAVGLLQLMPTTAQKVAAELNVEYDPASLTEPPINIRYGSYYLAKMLSTFSGNAALAAAAYNAGPSAVKRWLTGAADLPLDLFVARIPYRETRHYVSRVIGNWARYRYLDGGVEAVPRLGLELPPPVAPLPTDY